METAKKEIVFRTKITKKLAAMGMLPLAASAALAFFAFDAGRKFAPTDPSRYLFVGIPALISATILVSILAVCNHFLGRTISLTKDELTYKDNKTVMTLPIAEMAYSPPSEDATLATIMFSDGNNFIQIPQLFLGETEFKQLTRFLKKRRRAASEDPLQKTYSL